jgi:hypothetical protein
LSPLRRFKIAGAIIRLEPVRDLKIHNVDSYKAIWARAVDVPRRMSPDAHQSK